MIVLGLTGSIGMGKSEVARMFRAAGVSVFDADAAVHELYAPGGDAIEAIARRFPAAIRHAAVDRERLARLVLDDAAALRELESIVHPLVRAAEQRFLAEANASGARLVVLEIPLLFEAGGVARCDKIAVVSAPSDKQRERVLGRGGMDAAKFEAVLARQMPDSDKRAHADFVIPTGGSLEATESVVRDLVKKLTGD